MNWRPAQYSEKIKFLKTSPGICSSGKRTWRLLQGICSLTETKSKRILENTCDSCFEITGLWNETPDTFSVLNCSMLFYYAITIESRSQKITSEPK